MQHIKSLTTGVRASCNRASLINKRSVKNCARVWLVFLSALLSASSVAVVRGQDNRWTGIGPEGVTITALAVDPRSPTTLYAGTRSSGVLKSTDGGGNWTAINNGLTLAPITSLAIDPKTPTTLYVSGVGTSKAAKQPNQPIAKRDKL